MCSPSSSKSLRGRAAEPTGRVHEGTPDDGGGLSPHDTAVADARASPSVSASCPIEGRSDFSVKIPTERSSRAARSDAASGCLGRRLGAWTVSRRPSERVRHMAEARRRAAETSAGLLLYRRAPALEVFLGHMGGPFWRGKDV